MPKWIPNCLLKPTKTQKKEPVNKKSDLKLYATMVVSTQEELEAAFFFGLQKYLKEKKYPLASNIFPTKDKALAAAIELFFSEVEYQSKQSAERSVKWKKKK